MRNRRQRFQKYSERQQQAEQAAPPSEAPRPRALDPEKARAKTIKRAINILAARPRSIAHLRERLLEKEWTNEETVEAVIAKLREYGYLDDERFAVNYAAARVRQKPMGRTRLLRDLQLKKVERETATEALKQVFAETPEDELVDRAIEKRVRLRGLPQTRAESKSLFDYLLRQGFSYDLVIRKVRALAAHEAVETEASGEEDAPPTE